MTSGVIVSVPPFLRLIPSDPPIEEVGFYCVNVGSESGVTMLIMSGRNLSGSYK